MGTSETVFKDDRAFKDHPHACGDKVFLKYLLIVLVGSSPRVWGQAPTAFVSASLTGIIPTRVGTSQIPSLSGWNE